MNMCNAANLYCTSILEQGPVNISGEGSDGKQVFTGVQSLLQLLTRPENSHRQ